VSCQSSFDGEDITCNGNVHLARSWRVALLVVSSLASIKSQHIFVLHTALRNVLVAQIQEGQHAQDGKFVAQSILIEKTRKLL